MEGMNTPLERLRSCYQTADAIAMRALLDDVLDALDNKPVPPIDKFSNGQMWKICGNCRTQIYLGDKFCHECGKRIAWDK